jgi:hypothetical protein
MKPEKKITAMMNTTPATMPTQAAAAVTLERRGSSRTTGCAGGAVATGPAAGSDEDVDGSVIDQILQSLARCQL